MIPTWLTWILLVVPLAADITVLLSTRNVRRRGPRWAGSLAQASLALLALAVGAAAVVFANWRAFSGLTSPGRIAETVFYVVGYGYVAFAVLAVVVLLASGRKRTRDSAA